MYTVYASNTPGCMQMTGTRCHTNLELVEPLTLVLLLSSEL